MSEETPPPPTHSETAALLKAQVIQNIVDKIAGGGTPSKREQEILDDHFAPKLRAPDPAPESADDRTPDPAPSPTTGEATAEQIARWEATYSTKRRQLYRYRAKGIDSGDACPLDSPALMPAWWRRNMVQRIPAKLLAAAQQAALNAAADVASQAANNPPPPPPPASREYSFPDQVARLREEQRRIQAQLDIARGGLKVDGHLVINQADCESLLRQSIALTSELRKAENDLTVWLTAHEDLVNRLEVRAENSRIAGSIFAAVRRLVKSTRPLLAGKTDAEQDRLWLEKTLACFETMKEARFTNFAVATVDPTE